jgi:hypothetical protein
MIKVERREALRPTSLGARGWRYQLREADRSQGLPEGVSQTPGASRRSTGPAQSGEVGITRAHWRRGDENAWAV